MGCLGEGSGSGQGFYEFQVVEKSGMFRECEKREDLKMRIGFLDIDPIPSWEGNLVTRRPGSSGFYDGEKNDLRRLRAIASEFLRSQGAPDSGSVMWRYPHLPFGGGSACLLQELRLGKARATFLDCRQSLLHETVCLLCGEALPRFHPQGCGQGTSFRLAHRQGIGEAVYARATQTGRDAGAFCDRD